MGGRGVPSSLKLPLLCYSLGYCEKLFFVFIGGGGSGYTLEFLKINNIFRQTFSSSFK